MFSSRIPTAVTAARRFFASAPQTFTIGLIPADGIGREVIPAARTVIEAVSTASSSPVSFRFLDLDAGFEYFQKHGTALPEATLSVLRTECNGALFGSVSSPSHRVQGYSSPIVKLRKELDLYANVRPVASVRQDNASSVRGEKDIDMVIVRENTECLYVKQERSLTAPDGGRMAIADRVITENASKRVGRVAFRLALQRHALREQMSEPTWTGPPKVTIVHKSNVLSVTDGLFREAVRAVQAEDPAFNNVLIEEQLVDSMVYRMFREPHVFDVVVAPNLYGDILSDGAAALVGSLGVVPSTNMGDSFVIGEPVHGSAPDIAGQHKANPVASIRSGALLLEQLGLTEMAQRVYSSVDSVLREGRILTPDLGGKATTEEVTRAVVERL